MAQSSKPDLSEALKAVGRNSSGTTRTRLRSALVVSEIACAVVLLMCAGLLIRTVRQLQNVDPGFDYSQSLKMDLGLPASLRHRSEAHRFLPRSYEPGSVAPRSDKCRYVTPLPDARGFDTTGIYIEHQAVPPGQEPSVDRYIMTPGYLQALGIRLERGREITDQDGQDAPLVLLVSESLAARFWPSEDQSGSELSCHGTGTRG